MGDIIPDRDSGNSRVAGLRIGDAGRMTSLTVRDARAPDDLEAMHAIAVSMETAVLGHSTTTHEEIRSQVEDYQGERGVVRVAEAPDGHLVGWLALEIDEHARRLFVDAYVEAPEVGDPLLAELLDSGLAMARSIAGERPPPDWTAAAGSYAADEPWRSALLKAGFGPVRRFHRMQVDLDGPVEPPAPPEGAVLTRVGHDRARWPDVHRVMQESFREHWGFVDRPYEEFVHFFTATGFDPEQWWLVDVDGVPAAAAICDDSQAELGATYVRTLGVCEPYRHRGLGRLLLLTTFADAWERGRNAVRLSVDTENGTGAPQLYTSVGMHPADAVDAWHLPLA
jgi:GNAT superfamily N-acetyltransferase